MNKDSATLLSAAEKIMTMVVDISMLTVDDVVYPERAHPKALADWVMLWSPDLTQVIVAWFNDMAIRLESPVQEEHPHPVDHNIAISLAEQILRYEP